MDWTERITEDSQVEPVACPKTSIVVWGEFIGIELRKITEENDPELVASYETSMVMWTGYLWIELRK